MQIPEVIPARTFYRDDVVDPILNDKERKVIDILSQCRAARIASLAQTVWSNPLKGLDKIQTLVYWGILWSYSFGNQKEEEIVTLSPISEKIAGVKAYVPGKSREVFKIVTASELFLRALTKIDCTFKSTTYPLQGTLTINGNIAGVLVLIDEDPSLYNINTNCFIICEPEHGARIAGSLSFPALFTSLKTLSTKDIADSFCIYQEGSFIPVKVGIFQN